jgi:hypothetical protein
VEFAHGMEMGLLGRMLDLGYGRFKLLNQVTYTDKPPIFEHETGLRVLRKLYHQVPPVRPLIRAVARRSDFDTFCPTDSWKFPAGSSGPFGEQTYGRWMTSSEIMKRYSALHRAYDKAGAGFWWDLHAAA